ncbi:PREDICTED: neuropeptide F receptor-like [Papilio xuthus]|uniref:Neuropeptide F receptor-like n=1 Tax=Papilio xuthus TaxID=66420 RepID=A0AAJ6ZTM7_PAPXU|nr:PREDICTED: neuropeptide F receptor-like [Papilio xuthus]
MSGNNTTLLATAMVNDTMAAFNRTYSPLALNQEWPKLVRLIVVLILSIFGTIMNGFFICSFFVEKNLKRKGNVFLALVGSSDLIICLVVMPACAATLLSDQLDNPDVCHAVQFVTEAAAYSFTFFFLITAIEQYCQMVCSEESTKKFVNLAVNLGIFLVYGISFGFAAYGVYEELDYDYCQRLHYGSFNYRSYTLIFLHVVPCVITMSVLLVATLHVKQHGSEEISYRRSERYDDDYCRSILNMLTFSLYVIVWLPYLIILYRQPDTTDQKFYRYAWLGISRSVFTSIFYSTLSKDFQRAYSFLCNYCFCKTTVTTSDYSNNRRARRAAIAEAGLNAPIERCPAQEPRPPRTPSPEAIEL